MKRINEGRSNREKEKVKSVVKGKVAIPKEYKEDLDISEGDQLVMVKDSKIIKMRKKKKNLWGKR